MFIFCFFSEESEFDVETYLPPITSEQQITEDISHQMQRSFHEIFPNANPTLTSSHTETLHPPPPKPYILPQNIGSQNSVEFVEFDQIQTQGNF